MESLPNQESVFGCTAGLLAVLLLAAFGHTLKHHVVEQGPEHLPSATHGYAKEISRLFPTERKRAIAPLLLQLPANRREPQKVPVVPEV
jgi:hypothetical protein